MLVNERRYTRSHCTTKNWMSHAKRSVNTVAGLHSGQNRVTIHSILSHWRAQRCTRRVHRAVTRRPEPLRDSTACSRPRPRGYSQHYVHSQETSTMRLHPDSRIRPQTGALSYSRYDLIQRRPAWPAGPAGRARGVLLGAGGPLGPRQPHAHAVEPVDAVQQRSPDEPS